MKYNFRKDTITDLNGVNNKRTAHYAYFVDNFKIDFLYKPRNKSKGLIVMFHGSRTTGTPLPIVRGFKHKYKNCRLLSISDPLLEIYSECNRILSWYWNTSKYALTKHISSIIEKVSSLSNHDNILFFGSCGGVFPTIKYASMFNQGALLSNSSLYVDEFPYYEDLKSILAQNEDDIFDETRADQIIKKYGQPKYIILFNNEKDTYYLDYHTKPFLRFLEEGGMENIIDCHIFTGRPPKPGRSHHDVQYPDKYKSSFDIISTLVKSGFPSKVEVNKKPMWPFLTGRRLRTVSETKD